MYNNNNNNEVFYTSNTLPKIKIPQKIIELLENSKLQNNFQNFKKNLKECIINIFLLSAKINESIYFKNPNSSFNTKNIKIEDYINNLFKKFDIQSEQYIMPSLNLLDKKILILNIIKYYYYVLYYIYLNNYDNNITRQLIRRYITEYLILNMNQDNIGKIIIYYVYAYVLDYDKNITNKDLFIKFIQNQLENYKQFSSLRLNNKFNEKYKKNSSFNNIVSKENNNSSKVKPNSLLQNSLNTSSISTITLNNSSKAKPNNQVVENSSISTTSIQNSISIIPPQSNTSIQQALSVNNNNEKTICTKKLQGKIKQFIPRVRKNGTYTTNTIEYENCKKQIRNNRHIGSGKK